MKYDPTKQDMIIRENVPNKNMKTLILASSSIAHATLHLNNGDFGPILLEENFIIHMLQKFPSILLMDKILHHQGWRLSRILSINSITFSSKVRDLLPDDSSRDLFGVCD